MKGCAMTTSKLDQLTKRREELNAQIQAFKAKENQKKRKDETRKKILIGGVVMKMLKTGEMPQERLNQLLDKHLERTMDRELFKI